MKQESTTLYNPKLFLNGPVFVCLKFGYGGLQTQWKKARRAIIAPQKTGIFSPLAAGKVKPSRALRGMALGSVIDWHL